MLNLLPFDRTSAAVASRRETRSPTIAALLAAACLLGCGLPSGTTGAEPNLRVAFGEADITPNLESEGPVWLAGYGTGRQATGVHDPIMARCVVLASGKQRLALLSVDLVGMQRPDVERVRGRLKNFEQVVVSSTHNHEGPDVIGLWGPSLAQRGVNDQYVARVVTTLVELVQNTAAQAVPATARFGLAVDPALLRDSRQPIVKDAALRVLRFESPAKKTLGTLVQWNCHPEAMGSKNKRLTADFTGVTVAELRRRWKSPVAMFTGAVGGLMAPPREFPNYQRGDDDRWQYMTAYGKAVAELADKAWRRARPLKLTPFRVVSKPIAVPIDNKYYRTAQAMGVLVRRDVVWTGDPWDVSEPPKLLNSLRRRALVTEVGWLELGELLVACVPGEIYPELVTGEFQTPIEPAVDYPEAQREPTIRDMLKDPDAPWMLFGLCNDEIGYLIPKSQWDQQPPFAYGRSSSQYGEINACSPDAAPIIMQGLKELRSQLGSATPAASR